MPTSACPSSVARTNELAALLSLSDDILEQITWQIALEVPDEEDETPTRGWTDVLASFVIDLRDWALACHRLAEASTAVLDRFVCLCETSSLVKLARDIHRHPARAERIRWLAMWINEEGSQIGMSAALLSAISPSLVNLVRLEVTVNEDTKDMLPEALELLPSLLHLVIQSGPADTQLGIEVGYLRTLSTATCGRAATSQSQLQSLVLDDIILTSTAAQVAADWDDHPAFPCVRYFGLAYPESESSNGARDNMLLVDYAARHCPALAALSYDFGAQPDREAYRRLPITVGAFKHLQRFEWTLDATSVFGPPIVTALLGHANKLEVLKLDNLLFDLSALYKLARLRILEISSAIDVSHSIDISHSDAAGQGAVLAGLLASKPSMQVLALPWLAGEANFGTLRTALTAVASSSGVRLLERELTWYEWQTL